MTTYKPPDNLTESSDFLGFYDLKGNEIEWEPEKFSFKNEISDNLPEWSGSEMTNDDAIYWEKEISDLMEGLKSFQATLAEGRSAVIDEVFKFHSSEEYKKENFPKEQDLKASIAEIEKMDALLKIKNMEEKKAKLNRLKVEEESRTILTNLSSVIMSTGMKMNSEEFLRLLCDTSSDREETKGEEGNIPDDAKKGEKFDGESDKSLKTTGPQQKLKFVERNIQLAKCGRGVLSLTDEEKLRIESLLVDVSDTGPDDAKKGKTETSTKLDIYGIDDESKSKLDEIDQRLEAFSKKKSENSLIESIVPENVIVEEEDVKETGSKKSETKKNIPNRLLVIDKLLNGITSVTEKEISPPSPKDINRLIEESSQVIVEAETRPSPDVIAELVSSAKVLMPKFKYRFEEG